MFKNTINGYLQKLFCKIIKLGTIVFACMILVLSGIAHAECNPQFKKVVDGGFGDRFNIYIWSLKTFGDYLYATTLNQKSGGEIWRFDGTSWELVISGGFGKIENQGVRSLEIFNDILYAGLENIELGAEIWRSHDGINWECVMQEGFGNPDNVSVRGMAVFHNYLYVGTQNINGTGQIWRSENGSDWLPVVLDGFGDTGNSSMHAMDVYHGFLYVGTRNVVVGTQIWRSFNGQKFYPVVGPTGFIESGFGKGDGETYHIAHISEVSMFVGTGNWKSGFGVYQSSGGLHFNQVGRKGFGDRTNAYAWRFHIYEQELWFGAMNKSIGTKGGSIWRFKDGREEMVGGNGIYAGYGFDNLSNWGIRSFETFQGKLYIGTAQCWVEGCDPYVSGAEIWEWPGKSCP
jgi:hypothetical protein